jgi:hypothetical protein
MWLHQQKGVYQDCLAAPGSAADWLVSGGWPANHGWKGDARYAAARYAAARYAARYTARYGARHAMRQLLHHPRRLLGQQGGVGRDRAVGVRRAGERDQAHPLQSPGTERSVGASWQPDAACGNAGAPAPHVPEAAAVAWRQPGPFVLPGSKRAGKGPSGRRAQTCAAPPLRTMWNKERFEPGSQFSLGLAPRVSHFAHFTPPHHWHLPIFGTWQSWPLISLAGASGACRKGPEGHLHAQCRIRVMNTRCVDQLGPLQVRPTSPD